MELHGDALPADRLSDRALQAFFAFIAVTLFGYATFGVNPGLLVRFPGAADVYSKAFRFFAVTNIWFAWALLALFLTRAVRARWIPAFVILYAISLVSELAGTTTGFPFGEYRYSPVLYPMWFAHVPIVIPLSWFFMALPSYALARSVLPDANQRWTRVFLASAVLVSWDLSLDPAMSHATRYWMWGSSGAYYGMPWLNLLGWYVTGLVLMAALQILNTDRWLATLSLPWLRRFYLANLALPLGMNAAAGLWGAVIAAFAALAAAYGLGRWLGTAARSQRKPLGNGAIGPARIAG